MASLTAKPLLLRRKICHYLFSMVGMLPAFSLLLICDTALCAERFAISIPAQKLMDTLKDRNRITQYAVSVWAGRVTGVLKIEEDWHIEVNNDEYPQVKAFAGHGASWLNANDIKKGALKNFIEIEVRPDWGPLEIKIDLTVDIFMEEKERHIVVEKKDIVFTPMSGIIR